MKEKKLGRGLDFLMNLSSEEISEEVQDQQKVENIEIHLIHQNRFQPRENFDQESLKDLIESIKENGLLQPILVKKDSDSYELIAGERRLKACIALRNETIPAIILDIPETKLLQYALIENLQREDLNPIEEARAYQGMIRLENLTQEEVAKKLGKNRTTITNAIRLLDLPNEIQEHVSRGTISAGHARALLSLSTTQEIIKAFKTVLSENLSVRDAENLVRRKKTKPKKTSTKDTNITNYEENLKNKFGTKVAIKSKEKQGMIQFFFYSDDDFTRLYEIFNRLTS